MVLLPLGPSAEISDFEIVRRVLASTGCDGLGSRASDAADFALERIEEQLKTIQKKADCDGTNCGKCQQCLTVHEYFLKESVTNLRAQLRTSQVALVEIFERDPYDLGYVQQTQRTAHRAILKPTPEDPNYMIKDPNAS